MFDNSTRRPGSSRPRTTGGNLTGILIAPDGTLAAKKRELLKEAVPRAARIAFLVRRSHFPPQVRRCRRRPHPRCRALCEVRAVITSGLCPMVASGPRLSLVGASTFFFRDRKRIISWPRSTGCPRSTSGDQVEDGGLMAYGTSRSELIRTATYIDRIFKTPTRATSDREPTSSSW